MAASLRAWVGGLVVAACGSGSGCADPSFVGSDPIAVAEDTWLIAQLPPPRELDVLFVIDDSISMAEEQATLAANLASFVRVLEGPRRVPLDYRIGITTTDHGSPACTSTPEAGALLLGSCRERLADFVTDDPALDVRAQACTDACPAEWSHIETRPTAIDGSDARRPRPWIERIGGRTNLPEGLGMEQALQCLAPQGIAGCELESPLESMAQALRRSQLDDDPAFGFLRPSAALLVVIVTDEADCSVNDAWAGSFAPEDGVVPTSAACWSAGVECEGTSPFDDCHPVDRDVEGNPVAEHDAAALAVLHPLSRYVELLRVLEDRKQQLHPGGGAQVLVTLVAGVIADGSAVYRDALDDPAFMHDHGIGPGCDSGWGRAAPPVRLRALAETFAIGGDPEMTSICQSDWSPALSVIAEPLGVPFRPACVPACVADADPSTPDVLDPSCVLVQHTPNEHGGIDARAVPPCEPDGAVPDGHDACHVALTGTEVSEWCIDQGFVLEVRLVLRDGWYPPFGAHYEATCALSLEPALDCPSLP